MKVGILALQGSFAEHGKVLDKLSVEYIWVRSLDDLKGLTHLIIPGGESTTMEKLLKEFGMWEELQLQITKNKERRTKSKKTRIEKPLRVFGTCAGAILCQKFGADVVIDRNAYGAQQESFATDLDSSEFKHLKGMFIRAPRIKKMGEEVSVLASDKKEPVLVENQNFLLAMFHPELVGESRIHEYFLKFC